MIDQLAERIHSKLWMPWAKTLLKSENISKGRADRWYNECFKPYNELTEDMKQLDRDMVYKILPHLISNNSYLNDRKAVDRLKREYQEHGKLIVAFDFDNTVFDYHNDKLDLQPVISLLKKCSDLGFVMCLYTLSDRIIYKSDWVKHLGIRVDYINDSPVLRHKVKPYFNILLDDRAGLSASYNILLTTLKELNLYE